MVHFFLWIYCVMLAGPVSGALPLVEDLQSRTSEIDRGESPKLTAVKDTVSTEHGVFKPMTQSGFESAVPSIKTEKKTRPTRPKKSLVRTNEVIEKPQEIPEGADILHRVARMKSSPLPEETRASIETLITQETALNQHVATKLQEHGQTNGLDAKLNQELAELEVKKNNLATQRAELEKSPAVIIAREKLVEQAHKHLQRAAEEHVQARSEKLNNLVSATHSLNTVLEHKENLARLIQEERQFIEQQPKMPSQQAEQHKQQLEEKRRALEVHPLTWKAYHAHGG